MGSDFLSELAARPHWLALTRVLRLRFFALTGLDYRQMHRGSDERRELEDRACGWRRVVTAEHKDKVNYGPLKEFWHSELVSTEDNQNKDMVRVFLGYDSETREHLYDLHPRRATTCTLRAAVGVFRASEFAAQVDASAGRVQ